MTKLLALTTALLFTACVADESTDPTEPEETTIELKADGAPAPAPAAADDGWSACDHIVETEGPCAVACDPEKLAEYIPEDWCAVFVCHLDNGDTYRASGCN